MRCVALSEEDITSPAALPLLSRGWWRVFLVMRRRGLIFVQVPRRRYVDGCALYGRAASAISHALLPRHGPRLEAEAESFAMLRDTVDRFAWAYAFVRNGGTAASRLSDVFVGLEGAYRQRGRLSLFLEERSALDLDLYAAESWFVCGDDGAVLVSGSFSMAKTARRWGIPKSYGIDVCPG